MKTSLRTKTIVLIILIAAILSVVGLLVSGRFINRLVEEEYRSRAKEIADTVAVVIDRDRFESLKNDILKIYGRTEEKVTSEDGDLPRSRSIFHPSRRWRKVRITGICFGSFGGFRM